MAGATSSAVLEGLLRAGFEICGVVVAAGRFARAARPEPIVRLAPPLLRLAGRDATPTIADLAHARGIPAYELRRADASATLEALADLRPAVACVACFPMRIPPALLAVPRHGFLNLHPSLLPRHRGPEPLFWTFRAGERTAGATVHFMDEQLDTGDIVAQAPVELPDGIGGRAAEQLCTAAGTALLVEALQTLHNGTLARWRQPAGGSYEPWPATDDWRISTSWTAQRAFNFMRGSADWGQPYPVAIASTELQLAEALEYDSGKTVGAACLRENAVVSIQFTPGVLRARLW